MLITNPVDYHTLRRSKFYRLLENQIFGSGTTRLAVCASDCSRQTGVNVFSRMCIAIVAEHGDLKSQARGVFCYHAVASPHATGPLPGYDPLDADKARRSTVKSRTPP